MWPNNWWPPRWRGRPGWLRTVPESFADLRVRVCSPGGVTIYAVNHLERTAVRGHVADAVLAAMRRDREMSGE